MNASQIGAFAKVVGIGAVPGLVAGSAVSATRIGDDDGAQRNEISAKRALIGVAGFAAAAGVLGLIGRGSSDPGAIVPLLLAGGALLVSGSFAGYSAATYGASLIN